MIHIFDRGFSGGPWLGHLAGTSRCAPTSVEVRFIVRWQKHYTLRTPEGREQKAWEIARGKPTQDRRSVPARGGKREQHGILALPVRHPDLPAPPWLVVCRPGSGTHLGICRPGSRSAPSRTPGRSSSPTPGDGRSRVYRFGKSELALQSPRLWFWSNRQKLLHMASLAYAFLLSLLRPEAQYKRTILLARFCHRTGKRNRETPAPLYRLRGALSYLWSSIFKPRHSCSPRFGMTHVR